MIQEIKDILKEKLLLLNLPGVIQTTAALQLFISDMVARYDFKIRWLLFLSLDGGNRGRWIIPYNDYQRGGEKVFYDRRLFKRIYAESQRERVVFFKLIKELETKGLRESSKELAVQYSSLVNCYDSTFTNLMFPGFMTYMVVDPVINNLSKRCGVPVGDYVKSSKMTFAGRYQNSLKNILKQCGKKNLLENSRKDPKLAGVIKKHRQKFYWAGTNYAGVNPPTPSSVIKEIRGIKLTSDKPKRLLLKGKDKELFNILRQVTYWHDVRKEVNLLANTWIFYFLKKAEKLLKIPYERLCQTTPSELLNLLNGQKVKDLSKRNQAVAVLTSLKSGEQIFTGKVVREIWKKTSQSINKTEVVGTSACAGRVTGKVRIVLNVNKEGKSFKKGEILLTSMTRPDFFKLVSRASAVITDEGGMTSHAAVITRELKIPCIVGTKIATQVFKDGDKVEVDAEKGIVKKICEQTK